MSALLSKPTSMHMETMKKLLLIALLSSSAFTFAFADTFRVHYSIHGVGRDVTVSAESSAEARRTVMEMFPAAVVTGVSRTGSAHRK